MERCPLLSFYEDMRVSVPQRRRVISISDLWPFLFSPRRDKYSGMRALRAKPRWPWPCPCSLVISLGWRGPASHQCCDLPCVPSGPGPVSSLLSRIFSFTAQIWHATTTTTPPTTSAAGWHEWRGSVTQNVTGHDIMSHISTLILMMVMSRSIACVSWHHPGPVTMCGDRGAPLTAERLAHYQDGWSPFSSSPCHNIGGQCQAPTLLRKYERGMATTWREVTGVTVVRIYCLWEMKGGRMITTCRFLWPLSPENVIMWSHWSPDPGLLRGHLHMGIIPAWLLAPGPHYNALFAHTDNFKQNCTLFLWLGASVEATLAKENSAQGCPDNLIYGNHGTLTVGMENGGT